jgi:hypothetical protein
MMRDEMMRMRITRKRTMDNELNDNNDDEDTTIKRYRGLGTRRQQ